LLISTSYTFDCHSKSRANTFILSEVKRSQKSHDRILFILLYIGEIPHPLRGIRDDVIMDSANKDVAISCERKPAKSKGKKEISYEISFSSAGENFFLSGNKK